MSLEIVKRMEFDAPPERVWRAITDPDELAEWFPDKTADFRAEPGYSGAFVWHGTDTVDDQCGGGAFAVKVEIAEPFHTLVWHWADRANTPFDPSASTRVEWKLSERAAGGTVLVLRETGFENVGAAEGNDRGWDSELGELRARLENVAPTAATRTA